MQALHMFTFWFWVICIALAMVVYRLVGSFYEDLGCRDYAQAADMVVFALFVFLMMVLFL